VIMKRENKERITVWKGDILMGWGEEWVFGRSVG